ncbi:MAG: MFS transporter [Deltaproteobacteria bacterium]|nr:MFS transporter [Deltaproteobacteria bacterium]
MLPRADGLLGSRTVMATHTLGDSSESRSGSRYALGLLSLVYAVNLMDRQLLSILLEPIKQDLGISDTALGFLTGFAFAIFFSVAGIPIARWADRGSRRDVIAIGLVLWSLATAASGLALSFVHLALARIGVGVGEAAGNPPAQAMISDYFPPERRATAIAVFTMGANVGIMMGLVAGGWLADQVGWRQTFLIVGLPGIALALVIRLTLREPSRGASEGRGDIDAPPSLAEVLRYFARMRTYRHICAATALYNFASYGFLAWVPTFLIRVHEMSPTEVGLSLGPIAGIAGAAGTLTGGLLGDRLGLRDVRWRMWIPAVGGLGTAPFLFAFLFLPDASQAVLCYVPIAFFGAIWSGPTYAIVQGLAKLRMRAMAAAVLIFALNFFGMGLGPQIVGLLNDLLDVRFAGEAIRYSLLLVGLAKIWGSLHSVLGARSLEADLRSAAEPAGGERS